MCCTILYYCSKVRIVMEIWNKIFVCLILYSVQHKKHSRRRPIYNDDG